jgi:hypothetical protein
MLELQFRLFVNIGAPLLIDEWKIESKISNLCVAYMDVGEGREQERKL